MANTSAISVANLDFDEIKSNLKTFLKNQTIFFHLKFLYFDPLNFLKFF